MKLRAVDCGRHWDWRRLADSRFVAPRLRKTCWRKTCRSNSSSAAKPPKRFRISPPSIWPPRERIADACEKAATAQGVQVSIMVLDKDGNHVYMDRMDGQGYLNIVTAEMKARTALHGTRAQQEPHESRDPGSDAGIAGHSARLLSRIPAGFPSSSTNS